MQLQEVAEEVEKEPEGDTEKSWQVVTIPASRTTESTGELKGVKMAAAGQCLAEEMLRGGGEEQLKGSLMVEGVNGVMMIEFNVALITGLNPEAVEGLTDVVLIGQIVVA